MEIEFGPAELSLADWWFEDRKDPETRKYNPLAPSTVDSLRERLSKASSDLSDYEKADSFFWIVKEGGSVVGHVTMQNINRMMRTAEIGYGVTLTARGRGIGAKEVRL